MTRAILLALALYVATALCFLSYTAGLIEGVTHHHTLAAYTDIDVFSAPSLGTPVAKALAQRRSP
jgi:hypothetical protein